MGVFSTPTVVNSWNEWDPLKHVIVGVADGCCIPPAEPASEPKIPVDSDMRGRHGPRSSWRPQSSALRSSMRSS